ncbi:hypothetical protein ABVK25_007702 [Lepraria finkii]|uniref:Uncharacterized protein n=1 Tax=Lepraria finkii TaxID=1340010 RepID=A0ABR4B284_9LECA
MTEEGECCSLVGRRAKKEDAGIACENERGNGENVFKHPLNTSSKSLAKKPSAKDDTPENVAPKAQNGEENGRTGLGAGIENTQKLSARNGAAAAKSPTENLPPAPSSTAQENDTTGPSDDPPDTSSPDKK